MFAILLITAISIQAEAAKNDQGWVALFNGKNYAGLTFWIIGGPERSFDAVDDCMVIRPIPPGRTYNTENIFQVSEKDHLSQKPLSGFTYTRQQFRNFELKYEWKFERPANLKDDDAFTGNSGVLLYLTRILKTWPQSIEVEGNYLEAGKLLQHGKAQGEFKDYPDARKAARKPVGQWNEVHITCKEGQITVMLNGKLVAEGKTDQREGAIGFQASGATIYYRNIKVKELK